MGEPPHVTGAASAKRGLRMPGSPTRYPMGYPTDPTHHPTSSPSKFPTRYPTRPQTAASVPQHRAAGSTSPLGVQGLKPLPMYAAECDARRKPGGVMPELQNYSAPVPAILSPRVL